MNSLSGIGSGLRSEMDAMMAQIQAQVSARVQTAEQGAGVSSGNDQLSIDPCSMAGQAKQPFASHNKMSATDNTDQAVGAGSTAVQTVNGVTTTATGPAVPDAGVAAPTAPSMPAGGLSGSQTVNGVTTAETGNGGGGNTNVATATGGRSVQTVNGKTTVSQA